MKKLFAFILAAALLTTPALAAAGPGGRSADPAACAHHFEVSVVKEATCTEKGLLAYTCAKCGLTYTAETLPDEDAHDYQLTECTATCTEDGENIYTCTRCGDSYAEPASAVGHVPAADAPGCDQPLLCALCGEILQPALGHDYQYQYDAAFDEDGALTDYGTWKCQRCGAVMEATEGNAVEYYGLEAAAPEAEPDAAAEEEPEDGAEPEDDSSGTDLGLYEDDDSPADAAPVEPEEPGGGEDGADAGEEPVTDRKTGLWLTISAVVLCVVIVEAVVLTGSLKKDKTTL